VSAATPTTAFEPVSLAANGIHLSFGTNAVLRGVDVEVPAGTTTAVIGPSGSGKSTLLRTLNRLYEPDKGDILLDGRCSRTTPTNCASASAWCFSSSTCSRTARFSTT
jgi:ABC-type polar amino acid transport system ATPase subunit